jgi:hypothetical protein
VRRTIWRVPEPQAEGPVKVTSPALQLVKRNSTVPHGMRCTCTPPEVAPNRPPRVVIAFEKRIRSPSTAPPSA